MKVCIDILHMFESKHCFWQNCAKYKVLSVIYAVKVCASVHRYEVAKCVRSFKEAGQRLAQLPTSSPSAHRVLNTNITNITSNTSTNNITTITNITSTNSITSITPITNNITNINTNTNFTSTKITNTMYVTTNT